ncbi:MAG: transposase family protein [Gammaproteobacteria bacterium]|nr:transposase family protein [Gammaproteobacteria bacterium]
MCRQGRRVPRHSTVRPRLQPKPAYGARDLSFGLEAVRRESEGAAPENVLGFRFCAGEAGHGSCDGRTLKECQATCPSGRFMVTRSFSRSTAGNAKCFLAAVIEDLPYPLRSIQVDGGSEFRAGFEEACQALGIPLSVLSPRSPRLNGVMERASDSARIEFRSQYTSTPASSMSARPARHSPTAGTSTTA